MNNIMILRKIMIVLLAIATIIAVLIVVSRTMQNNSNNTSETPAQEQTVEIKSAPELIAEQKFSIIEINGDGFSEESVEVPVGGILQIVNDTDRDIMFDIRAENYISGLTVESGQTGSSPVFTEAGEYTISEFVDGEINDEVSVKIVVK